MKPLIFLLLLLFFIGKIPAQQTKTVKQKSGNFSELFRIYSKEYDSLIVFHKAAVFRINEEPYKIIAVKNEEWNLIEFYPAIFSVRKDSLFRKKCSDCRVAFATIMRNNLLDIPDEQAIKYPCRQLTDTAVDGQKVVSINDFCLREDETVFRIEFKIGKKQRVVSYRSPFEALKVCPNSKERIAFVNIVEAITNVR